MSMVRGSRWMRADQQTLATVAIAIALATALYALREILPNPNEGVTHLYAIP
jgi:hypothetical protein